MAAPARSASSCTRAQPFGEEGPRTVHVGPPVTLPAEPGTYTFPAPHVFADYRSVTYGIEQETGGHAITAQIRCEPEDGEGDVCNSQSVDVYRPPLGGAIPDRRTATEVHRGRELTIEPITEPDVDVDGAGDETEDRTNLRASATTQRLSGHRRAFDITVENAGPRTADRPQVQAHFLPSPGLGAWTPACRGEQRAFYSGAQDDDSRQQYCRLAPLAVGERRTVRLVVPDLGFGDAFFRLSAEGRDLASGDRVRGPRGPWPAAAAVAGGARPPGIDRQRIHAYRALNPQGPGGPAGATRQPNVHAHDHVPPRGQARRDAPAPAAVGPRERRRDDHGPLRQRHRASPRAVFVLSP